MIMNKKVSTLLTLSLMIGGSLLSSSAFAQTTPLPIGDRVSADNPLVDGGTYFIVQDQNDANTANDLILGYTFADVNQESIRIHLAQRTSHVNETDWSAYYWTVKLVSSDGGKYSYSFTNVATGQMLRVNYANGIYNTIETSTKSEDWDKDATSFSFGTDQINYSKGTTTTKRLFVTASLNNTTQYALTFVSGNNSIIWNKNDATFINLYSVADDEIDNPTEAGALNTLYNRAGFNFSLTKEDAAGNLFGEEAVKAIFVENNLVESGVINDKTQPYYAFPAGTYFAVSTPNGSFPTSKEEQIEYLKGCTFIAVSPTDNIDGNATCRAEGRGFTLTTVDAKDLNLYAQTTKAYIDENLQPNSQEVSVFNACFIGWEKTASKGNFALALNHVYYQAKTTDTKQTLGTNKISLNIIDHHHDITNSLVTDSYGRNFVFTLEETAAIDPISILSEDGASIYNIQFVSGDANDHKSEYGKYLTVATNTNQDLWANGSALADLNTPAYQFVISAVNGKDITFKNRETGKTFTAQLFKYGEGENEYSIALDTEMSYNVSDILNNGDVEQVSGTFNMSDAYIKLIPATNVDKFNGFLNVEDETIMTLAVARDFTPTSNKLYPVVNSSNTFPGAGEVKLTDEVSEAVQWQLVKANNKKPSYKTSNYCYVKDDKVIVKNWGDTVAVQGYKLQLIKDGQVIDKYLKVTDSDPANATLDNSGSVFYIKNNVDGSVSIKLSITGDKHISTSDYDVPNNFNEYDELQLRTLDIPASNNLVAATNVKTYLFNDSPLKSWQKEGHVTLQSEMGDYITMNDEKAGIVTSSEAETFYLTKTDANKAIPSFYISKGINGGDATAERLYLFNPVDSVPYLVNAPVDKRYEWDEVTAKAIFKAGTLVTPDTMKTDIKGEETLVAQKADNKGTEGGLQRFKFQIVETEDEDGYWYIRQTNSPSINEENGTLESGENYTLYLRNLNGKLTWTRKQNVERIKVTLAEAAAPTANESISATDVKVVALDGAVNVKNAAGKNVVVSTILGQIVANEVLTSDNATISVPAGIAIVSVDGEEAVKVSVK